MPRRGAPPNKRRARDRHPLAVLFELKGLGLGGGPRRRALALGDQPMLALEIFLNGRKVTLTGTEDLAVLIGIVNAAGKLGRKTSGTKAHRKGYDLWLTVGGLTGRVDGTPDEYLNWIGHKKLKIGDRIEICIRKVAIADSPVESTPAASEQ